MKRIFTVFALSLSVALISAFAQQKGELTTVQPGADPNYTWTQGIEHDFGKIVKGIPAEATFEFTNTGKAPLVISGVRASCGCTTPDYSKEPIAPGKKGFVKAVYNAANLGVFNKSITVTSNANEKDIVLIIKGEVIEK